MQKDRARILIVDDDEHIVFAFQALFAREGYDCIVARDGQEAVDLVQRRTPDVVFMDITMPRLDGLEALRRMKESDPSLPVILVTGMGTMQTAIQAIQRGAFDYLTKPLDVGKVRETARKALASLSAKPSAAALQFSSSSVNRYELIGRSAVMQDVYKLIGSISVTPRHTSVLIFGESGTGKELVARAIHANSGTPGDPFIAINCTALPETLLESELFGYERGAFTGAAERKAGKFEVAGSGSIFLDEIGDLSLTLQQKFLRVLQEREFERLGSNQPLRIEARFIAATNRNLEEEVRAKTFREDLFFRLNVATVVLPPLRDRKEDIPLLANYFLAKSNERFKSTLQGISEEAMERLLAYSYPGNVRELENIVERAVMLTKGDLILADALSDSLRREDQPGAISGESRPFAVARAAALDRFEKEYITRMLAEWHGNVSAAAQASGMTRQNFQRLIGKHGILPDSFRAPKPPSRQTPL